MDWRLYGLGTPTTEMTSSVSTVFGDCLSCGKLQNNLKRDLRARMLFLLTTQDYRSWSFSTGRNTLVVIMGFQKPTDTWYYFKLDTQSWRERTKALHQNLELKFPWETCLPRSSAGAVWGTSSCAAGPTITHCPVRVPSGSLVRRQYPATRVMAPNTDYQILNKRITRAQWLLPTRMPSFRWECCSPEVKARKRGHSDQFGARPPQKWIRFSLDDGSGYFPVLWKRHWFRKPTWLRLKGMGRG